ncbi:MAG: hypothetical protein ACXAES_14925 [Promethearchaeota archaeon]
MEENKLNLKSDTKLKTIEHINAIFDEKLLQTNIEKYLGYQNKIEAIEDKIQQAGLAEKLGDLKNQISSNAVKLEHVENDYNRKNNDYSRYLSSLKSEREEFQNLVEDVLNEKVRLNIVFSF